MTDTQKRLTAEEALTKASECRDMAKIARNPEHRIMLEHRAQTWDRIAQGLKDGH
jgi:hypothetical protein